MQRNPVKRNPLIRVRSFVAQVHGRGGGLRDDEQIAESQISELQNMRVLLEEARVLARNLALPSAGKAGNAHLATVG